MNLFIYKANIQAVLNTITRAKEHGTDLNHELAVLSASIHLPIIVCYYMIALKLGMTDEIAAQIEKLKLFHSVNEITGLEELKQYYENNSEN